MVAFKTIYNWLYAGLIDIELNVLRRQGKSKGCLVTFVERKTRFYLTVKMPDGRAKSMFSAIE